MRLIDGDKLLAHYQERCAGCKESKNYCEHCCDIADVISDIEDAPTIEGRKKGKWICHDAKEGYLIAKYSCSVCDYYSGTKRTNFCPDCGADMSGDGNEKAIRCTR